MFTSRRRFASSAPIRKCAVPILLAMLLSATGCTGIGQKREAHAHFITLPQPLGEASWLAAKNEAPENGPRPSMATPAPVPKPGPSAEAPKSGVFKNLSRMAATIRKEAPRGGSRTALAGAVAFRAPSAPRVSVTPKPAARAPTALADARPLPALKASPPVKSSSPGPAPQIPQISAQQASYWLLSGCGALFSYILAPLMVELIKEHRARRRHHADVDSPFRIAESQAGAEFMTASGGFRGVRTSRFRHSHNRNRRLRAALPAT